MRIFFDKFATDSFLRRTVVVPVDDLFIVIDVDTEGDYLKLQRKFQDKAELRVCVCSSRMALEISVDFDCPWGATK